MKKITLKLIPILFIAIFISGVAKADTYSNMKMLRNNGGGAYSGPIYTVTFQTDRQSYNKEEIVRPSISYSSATTPSTAVASATNMTLLQNDQYGAEQFSLPLLTNFKIPTGITPGTYFLLAEISPKFTGSTGILGQKNNNFNLISILEDMFVPKKAEACFMSITICDEFGCTPEPVLACNFGSGGSSGGSGGALTTFVGTSFTVNDSTPKIFVR